MSTFETLVIWRSCKRGHKTSQWNVCQLRKLARNSNSSNGRLIAWRKYFRWHSKLKAFDHATQYNPQFSAWNVSWLDSPRTFGHREKSHRDFPLTNLPRLNKLAPRSMRSTSEQNLAEWILQQLAESRWDQYQLEWVADNLSWSIQKLAVTWNHSNLWRGISTKRKHFCWAASKSSHSKSRYKSYQRHWTIIFQ